MRESYANGKSIIEPACTNWIPCEEPKVLRVNIIDGAVETGDRFPGFGTVSAITIQGKIVHSVTKGQTYVNLIFWPRRPFAILQDS